MLASTTLERPLRVTPRAARRRTSAPGLSAAGGPDAGRPARKSRTCAERLAQPVAVEPRVELRLVPAVEHVLGQVEADGVVHDGAAAHAHALGDLEAEVLRQRQRAVGVQVRELRRPRPR